MDQTIINRKSRREAKLRKDNENDADSWERSLSHTVGKSVPMVVIPQRTDAAVRGLQLVLHHHGASPELLSCLSDQLHNYLDSSVDETVWLERMKFVFTYPLSKYLRNDLPKIPVVGPFRPSGDLRRWMRLRLSAFNRRNTHLWYSWLQAKRATLPVSDSFVETTYAKHRTSLTQADKGDEEAIRSVLWNPAFVRVLDRVRRSVMKHLEGSAPFEEKSASTSACYEQTRSQGGQFGELSKVCQLDALLLERELVAMRFDPVVFDKGFVRYNVVSVIRCPAGGEAWKSLRNHAAALDLTRLTRCTIQAVLEPMKVRVISKGEALRYYTCRPLQHALHSALRDMDCFRLIGRPFSPTDILDLSENAGSSFEWFSVDYSAATDNLSWKYSGAIFRYLCSDLSREQYDLALRVLGPHSLYYPSYDTALGRWGVPEYGGEQGSGQLMGSNLSFPILCLANLGVYLSVTEKFQKGWTLRDRLRHVLVNGDDMLYAAPVEYWQKHIDLAEKVGLQMSVGKAYHHREYANINSTSVHFALHNRLPGPALSDKYRRETPWQINYLNAGLYFGQHKVQGRIEGPSLGTPGGLAHAHLGQDPTSGFAVNLNVLLNGCLPGKQTALLQEFLTEHAEALREECRIIVKSSTGARRLHTRNLFLPLSSGGMGVNAPAGFRFRVKRVQYQIAEYYLRQTSSLVSFGAPLPGYELEKLELELSVAWSKPAETETRIPVCYPTLVTGSHSLAKRGHQGYGLHRRCVAA